MLIFPYIWLHKRLQDLRSLPLLINYKCCFFNRHFLISLFSDLLFLRRCFFGRISGASTRSKMRFAAASRNSCTSQPLRLFVIGPYPECTKTFPISYSAQSSLLIPLLFSLKLEYGSGPVHAKLADLIPQSPLSLPGREKPPSPLDTPTHLPDSLEFYPFGPAVHEEASLMVVNHTSGPPPPPLPPPIPSPIMNK